MPANSLEHIVPESLGCPDGLVLKKGVCHKCNNSFGKLERALLTPFEFLTVIKQIPRKNGKLPTVDGFSSLSTGYDENGPVIYMNREKYSVQAPNNKLLIGTNKLDPIQNFEYNHLKDGKVDVSWKQELRFDRKAVRCLFKIALEIIALTEGLDAVRNRKYDAVKHFVSNGSGKFRAIMTADLDDSYLSNFSPRIIRDSDTGYLAMTILNVGFICDFDPNFTKGKMILNEMSACSIYAQVIPNWPMKLFRQNNQHP